MQKRKKQNKSNHRYAVSRLDYITVTLLLIFVAACAIYTTYTAFNIAFNLR